LYFKKGQPGASAHTYNTSDSRGRDEEDHSSKPAQANSSRDPIFKKPSQKRAGGVAQGAGSEFKPQYCKKGKQTQKEARSVAV
jgi:hypothetical protein